MIKCYTCRDLGKPSGCPDCGKVFETKISIERVKESPIVIPDFYKGKEWNKEALIVDREDLYQSGGNVRFINFVNQLEKFHETLKTRPLMKSVIISSLPKTSKTTLVYSCLQYALGYTDSVSKILTTTQVKSMLLKDELDELEKRICFVRVPDLFNKWNSEDVIRELLVFRSMLNKPTYLISDFPIKEIMPRKLQSILDYRGVENPLKFPAVIEYF